MNSPSFHRHSSLNSPHMKRLAIQIRDLFIKNLHVCISKGLEKWGVWHEERRCGVSLLKFWIVQTVRDHLHPAHLFIPQTSLKGLFCPLSSWGAQSYTIQGCNVHVWSTQTHGQRFGSESVEIVLDSEGPRIVAWKQHGRFCVHLSPLYPETCRECLWEKNTSPKTKHSCSYSWFMNSPLLCGYRSLPYANISFYSTLTQPSSSARMHVGIGPFLT